MDLAPVVVGGLIGVLGGLVGPPLAYKLGQKAEFRSRRREKLEELILTLYEHKQWLDDRVLIRVFGEVDDRLPSPLPKALTIAAMYFPGESQILRELDILSSNYEAWMSVESLKRHRGNTSDLGDGLPEVHEPYMQKFFEVIHRFQRYVEPGADQVI